jgi:Protein of unknown function (DUF2752)
MLVATQRLRAASLPRELIREFIRRPDALLLLALAPATLLNALWTLWFGEVAIHPPCLITLVTGHHCPGCGLTRAFTQLWLGHVHQAFVLNPLSPLVLSLLLVLFAQQLNRLVVYQRELFPPQTSNAAEALT